MLLRICYPLLAVVMNLHFQVAHFFFLLTKTFSPLVRSVCEQETFAFWSNFVCCCGLWLTEVFNEIGKFQCEQNVWAAKTNKINAKIKYSSTDVRLPWTFILVRLHSHFRPSFVRLISILLSSTFHIFSPVVLYFQPNSVCEWKSLSMRKNKLEKNPPSSWR